MMAVPLTHVLIFSMILFCIGLVGIFIRKDVLTIFLCVEILLNAANIVFVGVANTFGDEFGHVAALIVIAIAAAEAAIGLSIVIKLSHANKSMEVEKLNELRG
jgi:NADH-quinone oxidoreductase subunit K